MMPYLINFTVINVYDKVNGCYLLTLIIYIKNSCLPYQS